MEPPVTLPTAALLWSNEKNMLVLCPYCKEPEYRKFSKLSSPAICRGGNYALGDPFDFKVAMLGMKHRQNDCEAKRKYRKEAAAALALVRAAKESKGPENADPKTAPSSQSVGGS
jgi:hypothetical protein